MRTVAVYAGWLLLGLGLVSTGVSAARGQGVQHAPDGGSFERIQSIAISPKTDASFSATVVTSWTRVLEDGTRTTVKNHRTVARDTTGRVFQERRSFAPDGDKRETAISQLEYVDPVRREFYVCDPRSRTCLVSEYKAPPAMQVDTTPLVKLPNGAGTIERQPLGQKLVQQVEVVGSREITTIKPGLNGYQRPEPTIKEFWYSPRLDLNLVVRRFEPRGGAQDFSVENLNLAEPDPRLFAPPADYKIVHTSRY